MTDDLVSKASAEFKLSITRALTDQLMDKLKDLASAPLTAENVQALQKRAGVYELFLNREDDTTSDDGTGQDGGEKRVYVGKADKNLATRLERHRRKLSGRAGIELDDIRFKCLYVDEDLDAASPEKLLQRRYTLEALPWNTNGFGNNDPGRKRDDSLVTANHFDAEYPANLDLVLDSDVVEPGEYTVRKFLMKVKRHLPFNLRFEDKTARSKELTGHTVYVPRPPLTVRDVITLAIETLPEGWQATALPGYVILYREKFDYESARLIWREVDGAARQLEGRNLRDEESEVDEKESDEDTEEE